MRTLAVVVCICLSSGAFALRSDKIVVSGVVRSFDDKKVVLIKNGHPFTVPRKALKNKFKAGDSVSVELDTSEN